MRAVNLFFQLHRPYEIKKIEDVDTEILGGEADFREANRVEYQPLLAILERNAQKYSGLKVSLAVSGTWLEQAERWDMELIRRIRRLANSGHVEIVAMPYHNDVAWFVDKDNFADEMKRERQKLLQMLMAEPVAMMMPHQIYNDEIGEWAREHDYEVMLVGDTGELVGNKTSNQVFVGPKGLNLVTPNQKFSRAILEAQDIVMAEVLESRQDFADEKVPMDKPVATPRKKSAATDYLRNVAQSGKAKASADVKTSISQEQAYVRTFSAKKFQKELELEALRGNKIAIALDPVIFRRYRSEGIVRFFDEFFTSYLKVSGNRLVSLVEMAGLEQPKVRLVVKNTISDLGEERDGAPGIERPEKLWYLPPSVLEKEPQKGLIRDLFALKGVVMKAKDQGLWDNFGRLGDMEYFVEMDSEGAGRYRDILKEFEHRINEALPQPLKLSGGAKSQKKAEKPVEEPVKKEDIEQAEEDFAVKVKRVEKSKAKADEETKDEDAPDVIPVKRVKKQPKQPAMEIIEDSIDVNDEDEGEEDLPEEIEVIAKRMSREKSDLEEKVDEVLEAEIID